MTRPERPADEIDRTPVPRHLDALPDLAAPEQREARDALGELRQHEAVVIARDAVDRDAGLCQLRDAALQLVQRLEAVLLAIDDVPGEDHRPHATLAREGHGAAPRRGGREIRGADSRLLERGVEPDRPAAEVDVADEEQPRRQ